MRTAVLIDGSFFLRRYRSLYDSSQSMTPTEVAKDLHDICLRHVYGLKKIDRDEEDLYRIFFYDCAPLAKKVHNPIDNRCLDYSKTPQFIFQTQFHEELKKLRKVAVRMGTLKDFKSWVIKPSETKALLSGKTKPEDLQDSDLTYQVKQSGVDMKIGLDIASLAYKKLVGKIILISGDSDFIPAAKLARREGIDIVLDPMKNPIDPGLHEHIDGLNHQSPSRFASKHKKKT